MKIECAAIASVLCWLQWRWMHYFFRLAGFFRTGFLDLAEAFRGFVFIVLDFDLWADFARTFFADLFAAGFFFAGFFAAFFTAGRFAFFAAAFAGLRAADFFGAGLAGLRAAGLRGLAFTSI